MNFNKDLQNLHDFYKNLLICDGYGSLNWIMQTTKKQKDTMRYLDNDSPSMSCLKKHALLLYHHFWTISFLTDKSIPYKQPIEKSFLKKT